jgi:hypothetical protein
MQKRPQHTHIHLRILKTNETYPFFATISIIHEDSKVRQVITNAFCQGAVYYPRLTSLP